jgi:glutathionylspermidine synthase
MQRDELPPRPDWRRRVEALGFDFHTLDGAPYWVEDGCYRFSAGEIDRIEDAGNQLHAMCVEAVAEICGKGDFWRVGLGDAAAALAEASWQRGDLGLLGRMDLAYDGRSEPKLLEYNADTPTALLEASVVQWYWLEETGAGRDQFNLIHEKLVSRWPEVARRAEPVHFAGCLDSAEDAGTLGYLRETCREAGFESTLLDISDVGYRDGAFTDLDDNRILQMAKLYPWEWMLDEGFAAHLPRVTQRWIEPAWKQVLSNKALLPLLWEMFPGHPNLLPAAFDPRAVPGKVVRKPQFGREGEGVTVHEDASALPYEHGWIVQGHTPLYQGTHGHALLGLWVVGDEAAGLGMREDDGVVTRNTSRFVPHCFD